MATIPSQPATAGSEHPQRVLDPKAKARLQRAVKEFESVMVGYMLKSMRSSVPKDEMFGESYGGDMMEGLFDGELAKYVSRGSSLGLGEMLYKEITGEEMPKQARPVTQRQKLAAPEVSLPPANGAAPGVVAGPTARSAGPGHASDRSTATAVSGQPSARDIGTQTGQSTPTLELGVPREQKKESTSVPPAAVSAPPDTVRRRLEALDPIIRNAADTTGVNASLLKAVIATESGGRVQARSSANAKGLMQLIDSTAAAMGVRNVWDPTQNVQGGARYLGQMMDRFGGNLEHALASYNAGPGAVEKHKGVPPYRETQAYVGKVLEYLRYFEQQEAGSDDQD